MEPEGSLLCSQEPTTGLYTETNECSLHFQTISLILVLRFSRLEFNVNIHPEDGNWNVCRNVGQVWTFDAAHPRKPKFYKKFLKNILILSSHIRLVSPTPRVFIFKVSDQNLVSIFHLPMSCYMSYSPNTRWFDHPHRFCEYKLWRCLRYFNL
jgi:hypothetical protein